MDDSRDRDHLAQRRGTNYTLDQFQTLMDTVDGLVDNSLRNDSFQRDSLSPTEFLRSQSFSTPASWTVPPSTWEIQSGVEFDPSAPIPTYSSTNPTYMSPNFTYMTDSPVYMPRSPVDMADSPAYSPNSPSYSYLDMSPLPSPRLSSPTEIEHSYAAVQSATESVDSEMQNTAGDASVLQSTSESSTEFGSDVDIESFRLHGSDHESSSGVASVYQDAPMSPDFHSPGTPGWLGRVFDTVSSQDTQEMSHSSLDFPRFSEEERSSASPEIAFRSSSFTTAFIRRRAPAPRSPSPTPPSPSVASRFSLSAGQSAQISLLRSTSSLRGQRSIGRSSLFMPVFESRNGSVTLTTFPPTEAPTVVVEDLTPMTKKTISPQVRKVMGKLGMEFGQEPRSSRAPTPDPCSICFELPTVENASLAYPCLHAFCDACISQWVKTKSSCPNCQAVCTKILYNIRAELDYDSKDVPNRNTLIHPTSYDGDLLQFFFHMNHRRANLNSDRSTTASLASSLSRTWRGQQASRGNPYLNRMPIREPFEVAAIFTRSFPDIPSPADQELLLPHLFEVSRVSFRRRVYVEGLIGAMNATSAQSATFIAPAEIGPQVIGDPRFHPRVLPWLRREVLAVLVPEVSNAQREQLYQIVSDILRSQRSILKTNFVNQISGFVLASRVDKFWEQMVQFLLSRVTMGVWDRFMLYFNAEGAPIGLSQTSASSVRPPPPPLPPVTLVNINLFSDDEDTDAGPVSTHSYPNQDPDDSDDSVQFLSVRQGRPARRPAPLIVLSSDDDAETVEVTTPPPVAPLSPLGDDHAVGTSSDVQMSTSPPRRVETERTSSLRRRRSRSRGHHHRTRNEPAGSQEGRRRHRSEREVERPSRRAEREARRRLREEKEHSRRRRTSRSRRT